MTNQFKNINNQEDVITLDELLEIQEQDIDFLLEVYPEAAKYRPFIEEYRKENPIVDDTPDTNLSLLVFDTPRKEGEPKENEEFKGSDGELYEWWWVKKSCEIFGRKYTIAFFEGTDQYEEYLPKTI